MKEIFSHPFDNSLKLALLITILFFGIMGFIVYRSIPQVLINSPYIILYLILYFFLINLFKSPHYKPIKIFLVISIFILLAIGFTVHRSRSLRHLELGQNYLKIGNYNLARKELEASLKHPGYFKKEALCNIHFNLIWLYLNNQEWDSAYQESFRLWRLDRNNEIIKIDSDSKGTFYYAFCYDKKNMVQEARERYLKVLSQYPTNHTVHYRLSKLYPLDRELEKAIYHCKEAIRLFPESHDYQNLLGGLYVYKADFSSAVKEYQKALILKPSDKDSLISLCTLYTTYFQRKEEALSLGNKLVKKYPSEATSHQLLARAYIMNSKYEEAIREYRYAIRLEPKNNTFRNEFKEYLKEYLIENEKSKGKER